MLFQDTIENATDVIKNPSCWTQRARARDHTGSEVSPYNKNAIQWCSIGAVEKVSHYRKERDKALELLAEVSEQLFGYSLEYANDHLSHDEIMRLFTEAGMKSKPAIS